VSQFICARKFCKVKVDEGMVNKGMQFKFWGENDKLISSYKWPYSISRRFAIDIFWYNKSGINQL
jgi:hypothetical protein